MKHRQLSGAVKWNLYHRVLKRWRFLQRFIPSNIRRIQRVMDAQTRALLNYKPEGYPGRITYFLREEFSNNPQARIGAWGEFAAGGLDVRIIPADLHFDGHHGNIFKEPHVRDLAQELKTCMEKAQKERQDL